MNSRPALRRRTDPRSAARRISELTSEERQAAYLFRLSGDVHQACVAFLKSRQLSTGDEASWRGINTRLRDSNGTSAATEGNGAALDPRGTI